MRVIFNEEMKAIASNIERMAELVAKAMNDAGSALLNADLEAAQTVIDKDADLDALEASTIDQCLTLLARQNPVATDLREVVATMRLAATFERMGDLTSHIAQITRRTWPESAIAQEGRETIVAMVDFLHELSGRLTTMVANRDVQMAETIIAGDDALDKLHEKIFELVEGENWKGTCRQLIDVVLLSRFIERIGDHCVAVARQIVFIVSGFDPSKKPEPDKDTVVA
ncbi:MULTISPECIES: phosphate signaling complex protein PhoU [Gardnerella]|uniref:phosphate signaling complex protein PhoU n=1 Tax=Gardnerella TaxID=2701 RepID=UPI0007E46F01|nr:MULTISPECIES: phosphate signaling complex protein PhoU [Gardnerella]MDK8691807.1 phosphate signaling complex protein PhoU [Gardnerella swidsinskii]PMC50870.1 phosphate transport system regulatory protein PhoU [Gardnerella vaginalis]PMC54069.1 phosphate transport system regulatory protein PhoU [Gardnerella vaginalis]RFD73368.1 PhoU family transcriptional regulator [Gardnerella vaginalis]